MSLFRPLAGRSLGGRPLAGRQLSGDRTVTPGKGVGVLNAFSAVKAKIIADSADVIINVVGDSTGNAVEEFIYTWFEAAAAQYPTHTFEYYPSADPSGVSVTGGYGTVATISTGTGSHKVKLYNNSIAGELIMVLMGSLFSTAFPETPDLVIWNHGKNHVVSYTADLDLPIPAGEFVAAFAQVQEAFPTANHVVVKEYPNRDDSNGVVWSNIVDLVASFWPEMTVADLYNVDYVSGDYSDNVHLNTTTGAAKAHAAFMRVWDVARPGVWTPATPWVSTKAANLLDGDGVDYNSSQPRTQVYGDFNDAVRNGSTPGGWSAQGGTITYADEAVTVVSPRTLSQKMTGSGAQSRVARFTTATRMGQAAGQWVCLLVQNWVDANSDSTVGRVALSYTAPSVNGGAAKSLTSRSHTKARGAYRYMAIGPLFIPADVSALSATLYFDSDSTADTEAMYVQKAVVSVGKAPRDTL